MSLRTISAISFASFLLAAVGCSAASRRSEHQAFVQSRVTEQNLTKLCGRAADVEGSAYLDELAARLAPAVQRRARHPLGIRWVVVGCRQPYAYSLGGGAVLVSLGLLRGTRSEAELAFVTLHELSHELLGHPAAVLSRSTDALPERYRELESEADALAIKLLAFAGYDPRLAVAFLQRLSRGEAESLSTLHPHARERARRLAEIVEESGWQPPGRANSRAFQQFHLSVERVMSDF